MVRTRTACLVARVGIGGALVGIAGCSQTPQERLDPPPGFAARPSVSGDAAERVEELTTVRARHDEDGDGLVSPAEAEGYYRRYFGQLDDNNDGRLSRAELDAETPGAPEVEVAEEELVGPTEEEYLHERLRQYDLRADPSVGMLSTKDFEDMVGSSDPAIGGSRPRFMP
jgi:hypothetical protein